MGRKPRRAVQQSSAGAPDRTLATPRPRLAVLLLLVVIATIAVLRLRVIDLPLERDEGEYAYAGQLLLDGIPPYRLAWNLKWPGTYAAYAVMTAVLGESIRGIRIGITIVTSLTAALLFLLARQLWGDAAAVVAAATHLVLAVSVESLGLFGHATHFVALCAAGGFLLLQREGRLNVFAAGVVLALAAVMKQPGVFFGLAAAIWLGSRRAWKDTAVLAAGATATLIAMFSALHLSGVFPRFWFWTIDYARQYGNAVTRDLALQLLQANAVPILTAAPLLWLIVASGLVLTKSNRGLVAAMLAAGVAATIPGLHFRSHYFIVLFPAAALLAAGAIASAADRLRRAGVIRMLPAAFFAVALVGAIQHQWKRTSSTDMASLSRALYGKEPFPESVAVADYIRGRTSSSDRIAVIGSEPQIYFYAHRKSATGYLYAYPLMEPQPFASQMQREMIDEITKNDPAYLVVVNVSSSWGGFPTSDLTILKWMWSRAGNGWEVEGVADMLDSGTVYVWGEAARTYRARALESIVVLRREPQRDGTSRNSNVGPAAFVK